MHTIQEYELPDDGIEGAEGLEDESRWTGEQCHASEHGPQREVCLLLQERRLQISPIECRDTHHVEQRN